MSETEDIGNHSALRVYIRIVHITLPLLIVSLLDDSAFVFVYIFCLPTYLPESLGSSAAIAAGALSAYGISKLFSQFAAGIFFDVFGARRALVAGFGLRLIATCAILFLAHLVPCK